MHTHYRSGTVAGTALRGGTLGMHLVLLLACIAMASHSGSALGEPNPDSEADAAGGNPSVTSLTPRWIPAKPARTELGPSQDRNRVVVKFVEGSDVRMRPAGLVSLRGENLAAVRAVLARHRVGNNEIRRYFTRPENELDDEKRRGEALGRRQLADLNAYFEILVPSGVDAGRLCDDLNSLSIVELAEPAPLPAPPPVDISPVTPDFTPQQGYRAPPGLGGLGIVSLRELSALDARQVPGGDGSGTTFVDIEYSWQLDHEDLELPPTANIDTATAVDPFGNTDHGTAVLGMIVGRDNGYGVTGIAPAATARVAPANTQQYGFSVARAVSLATAALNAGDVILLEQQTPVCGAAAYGPVEWNQPTFDAISTATAVGLIVVEAAGNGSVDLDAPACLSRFDTTVRDSGAIIVGAGHPTTRARLSFSSYGSRVNVQGWGSGVTTTGYGAAFNPGDVRQLYTYGFSGTSSASPMVTGAALAVQGARRAIGLAPLSSQEMRQRLIDTGKPQYGSEHIGPLPNVPNALPPQTVPMPNLISPGGGEILMFGSTMNVQWNNELPPETFFDGGEFGAGRWTVSHGAGTADWGLDGSYTHQGDYAWSASGAGEVSDQYLTTTERIPLPLHAQLSFAHAYNTQSGLDGGVVEMSTDGVTWTDLGPLMTVNGYNSTISTEFGNPLGGRQAFSGQSGSYGNYVETVVDLSGYAGLDIYLRFRMGTDMYNGSNGWHVDNVRLSGMAPTYHLVLFNNCGNGGTNLYQIVGTTRVSADTFTWNIANTPFGTREDYCLVLWGSAPGYLDSPATYSFPFTISLDSDGDLLSDVYESNVLGTNPLSVDSDYDGLTDGSGIVLVSALPGGVDMDSDGYVDNEWQYGTSSTNSDSDGDTILDGDEVLNGMNPLASNVGDVGPRGSPNGVLNAGDVVVLTRILSGAVEPTSLELQLGDMNNDHHLTIADLLLLERAIINNSAH